MGRSRRKEIMSDSSYRDVHRLVLQAFVQEAAISVGDLEKLVVKLCNELGDHLDDFNGDMTRSLDHFILVINQKLESFGMGLKLKKRRAVELDGKVYWVLVNTLADFTSKLATDLSDKELLAFKKILTFLANSKYGNITFKELSKGLDHEAKEALLNKLLVGKWLEVCPSGGNGKYTAGVRTMVELENVMRDLGARECTMNGTPVLLTQPYKAWLRQQTGEEVNVDDLESNAEKGGSDGSGSDEEEEEEEAEILPESNRTRQSLRARLEKKRGKRVQDNNSDDDDDEEEEEEEQEKRGEVEKEDSDEEDEEEENEDEDEDDDNEGEEVPASTKARLSRNSRQASKREQLVEEDHSDDEEEEGEVVEVEEEDEEEGEEEGEEDGEGEDEDEEESEEEEEEVPEKSRSRRNLKRPIAKTNGRKKAEAERTNAVKKARTTKTRRTLRTRAGRKSTEAQEDSSEEEESDDEDRNGSQSPPSRAASKRPVRKVENSYIDEESSEESE